MARRNAIVAQSGGPSPVINASLQGVIEACFEYPQHFDAIYGAWHGVEGILKEELIDIRSQDREEIKLLRSTPSAGAIGTCRYKLKKEQKEDFSRIIEVFRAHDIGFFFYIGGNDSMETAQKVSEIAKEEGLELVVTGIPKTIDNDLGDEEFRLLDHTPGYGSAARYWSYVVQNLAEENRAMSGSEPVCVIQTMGRTSGFIPAAARLADLRREIPLQIYFAEAGHSLESLADCVNEQVRTDGRCLLVVSEGFDAGPLGELHDDFGHVEYSSSKTTVVQQVVNYLNDNRLKTHGLATAQVPGALQRCVSLSASRVDIEEAYEVAWKAVEIALKEGSGWMATILRKPVGPYEVYYDKVRLERMANSERHLPRKWISKNGFDVTDDFVHYALPLVGDGNPDIKIINGFQRFARFKTTFIARKTREYQPVRMRGSQT
jgi:ATP-dependent phosphofructokinase / diphosphate-dependent phosphofructokinase